MLQIGSISSYIKSACKELVSNIRPIHPVSRYFIIKLINNKVTSTITKKFKNVTKNTIDLHTSYTQGILFNHLIPNKNILWHTQIMQTLA